MFKLINSFEKLGYSLRYSDESSILLSNFLDDIICIELHDCTVIKYWCDSPVPFDFSEILLLSDFFTRYLND